MRYRLTRAERHDRRLKAIARRHRSRPRQWNYEEYYRWCLRRLRSPAAGIKALICGMSDLAVGYISVGAAMEAAAHAMQKYRAATPAPSEAV